MWYDHFNKTRLKSSDQIQGNHKNIHKPNLTDMVSNSISVVQKCPPLHLPEHVHGQCSLNNAWGSRCQLTCSQGYRLVGHDVTECGDKLKWTNPLPHCVGKALQITKYYSVPEIIINMGCHELEY
jgi:hypothetical protein